MTKTFPIEVVLTARTGVMMTRDFADVHELIEHVLGYPVWTHELGSDLVWVSIAAAIDDQIPGLAGVLHTRPASSKRGWDFLRTTQPWIDAMAERFGHHIELRRGNGVRTADPLETAKAVRAGSCPALTAPR